DEEQLLPLRLGRRTLADDAHRPARLIGQVTGLHELASDHWLALDLAARRGPVGELEQAHVLLLLEQRERFLVEPGREEHLDELLAQLLRAGSVDAPVERDDTAIGALRVAGEGALIGGASALAERAAAGVV